MRRFTNRRFDKTPHEKRKILDRSGNEIQVGKDQCKFRRRGGSGKVFYQDFFKIRGGEYLNFPIRTKCEEIGIAGDKIIGIS